MGRIASQQQGGQRMLRDRVSSIAILGGGAAGWLAAATLARLMKPDFCAIRLIDCTRSGAEPISVTALPSFHRLNKLLGIDEQDLMRRTGATFRLGVRFIDWSRPGAEYFHSFAPLGSRFDALPFHQYWLRLQRSGLGGALDDYSVATVASREGRFARPLADRQSVLSLYSYGYHFHAAALAACLRQYAQAHGVVGIEHGVSEVRLRAEDGFVDEIRLDDGSSVRADLYIDCTGASGTAPASLPGQQPWRSPRIDWSHWLPCDRAIAVACAGGAEPPPYSHSSAQRAGWRWQVPLQPCIDSGFAYASSLVSDDEAISTLLSELPGRALGEPRRLCLSPGRPTRFWERNWLTLTGGTLEPLESTSLHLVQTGITRLLTSFPVRRFSPDDIEEYNRLTILEHERIRDFLILHYKATRRDDSPLWRYCAGMAIPDTLRAKIELFQCCGRVPLLEEEHFGEESWLSVLFGQELRPADYDPLADVAGIDVVTAAFAQLRGAIHNAVATLPMHARLLAQQYAARVEATL
jgi:tryptophan 7-halogenase